VSSWPVYLSAAATPLLAIFGIYIGFRQWLTARDKLRLDLFDRRLMIFEAIIKVMRACGSGRVPSQDEQLQFLIDTQGTRWLFRNEIVGLKKEVWEEMCRLELLRATAGSEDQSKRSQNSETQAALRDWFRKRAEAAEDEFAKYLELRH
jgi:hypothetical protein